MARELANWLDTYIEYTDNSESPLSYHIWSGLSVIAGALQRRVYLKWWPQIIYPNLYVVLVGPSGRTRKGVALGIAKDILRQVPGISIAPESSSGRQAMIMAMKRSLLNFQDPTDGKVKLHCALTAFSEELSVFLGQGDIAYLSNLTDWYDSKDDWEYETIGRGKDTLKGLCLNVMGGTAPDWIQSMIPPEAVGGGFTSRVIFIVETEKRKIVPEPSISEREKDLQGKLIRDLERIGKLAGAVSITPDARKLYVDWYVAEDTKLSRGEPAIDDVRFAGYCERRATHIKKLMLLCSASRGDDMVIRTEDFHLARNLLVDAEKNMGKTFGGFGKARFSDSTETIKEYIKKVGTTTRKILLQKFYLDVDAPTLGGIEETLRQMRCISVTLIDGGDKLYNWIGE